MFKRPDFLTRPLFQKLYGGAVSRCFGYGMPYTSMVPMADFHNHSDRAANSYQVINPKQHLRPDLLDKDLENNTYFTKEKYLNNYEHLFSAAEVEAHGAPIKGAWDREAYLRKEALLSLDFQRAMLASNQIWRLPAIVKDDVEEDNDTSSNDSDADEEERVMGLEDYVEMDEYELEDGQGEGTVKEEEEKGEEEEEEEGDEEEEEDQYENFAWFKCTPEVQQNQEGDTYVVFFNDTRRTIEPGQELHYCYGARSNLYLFLYYGFTM